MELTGYVSKINDSLHGYSVHIIGSYICISITKHMLDETLKKKQRST